MKKILPINLNPYIRAYSNHAFHNVIDSSPEKVAGKNSEVAILEINNYNKREWNIYNDSLRLVSEGEKLHFYANKWNQGMNTVFTRPCRKEDTIELCIEKQIYAGPFANIKIFISKLSKNDFLYAQNTNDLDFGITLGNFSKDGIYYLTQKYLHTVLQPEPVIPINLKLIKRGKEIFAEYSTANIKSPPILIKTLKNEDTVKTIGFAVSLGNNIYFEWLFSNYINLEYYRDGGVKLDFLTNPVKNYHTYTYDYFIDTNIDLERDLQKIGFTLDNYIKKQINLRRYVELSVNDNINFAISDEGGKYFHHDLIYGYDDEKQTFNNLFYDNGLIKSGTISYTDFMSDRNKNPGREVFVLKYNPGYEGSIFSKKNILQLFLEYRDGVNISYCNPLYDRLGIPYGIKCLEVLCLLDEAEKIADDIRITHTLYEHALCNKDRVEFLFCRKFILNNDYVKLTEIIKKEENLTLILRNSILKMKMKKQYDLEKISNHMKEIYLLDSQFTNYFIFVLGKN